MCAARDRGSTANMAWWFGLENGTASETMSNRGATVGGGGGGVCQHVSLSLPRTLVFSFSLSLSLSLALALSLSLSLSLAPLLTGVRLARARVCACTCACGWLLPAPCTSYVSERISFSALMRCRAWLSFDLRTSAFRAFAAFCASKAFRGVLWCHEGSVAKGDHT